MSSAQVLSVPRGALIVLHDVRLSDPKACAETIRDAVGHDEFAIICTESTGRVNVISDPDKMPSWLARKLASAPELRAQMLAQVRPSGPVAPTTVRKAGSLRR